MWMQLIRFDAKEENGMIETRGGRIHGQIELNTAIEPVCESCHHRDNCIIRKLGEDEVAGTLSEDITPKGEVMLDDKDSGDFIHILKSGSIKVALKTDLENTAYGFYFPRSVFFLNGFLGRESKHNAIALEQTRTCKIPITTMLKSLGENPKLYSNLICKFRKKLDSEMYFSEIIFGKKSISKISGFILYIFHKNNQNGKKTDEIILTMSRVEISNYLGITHESVSRALKFLVSEGVIDVFNKKISINNFSELEDIYNAD
jgi:CRP/FNR family transcriptional regulator